MAALTLHPMKEIRLLVPRDHRLSITEWLDEMEATRDPMFGNVSGHDSHEFCDTHFMVSDLENQIMIMTVVPEETVGRMIAGLRPLMDRYAGLLFLSDVLATRHYGRTPATGQF